MSEMTFDDARDALSEAAALPEGSPAPATSEPAPSTPEVGTTGTTEPASSDSFTRSDLGSLLEGVNDPAARESIERAYKSFQGDYTRSKQELSQQYAGIDPAQARASLEFVQALETDPNFVVQVHQQLTDALTQAGYTPAQAAAAASQEINSSLGGSETDEYAEPESGLAKEVAELRSWKESQEAQQYEHQLASHLQRQEMAIRQADPSLTEPEVDRIYELAFAHGGDLVKAYQGYQSWKNDLIGQYVDAKATAPSASGMPDSTGHSTEGPRRFESVDEAHKAAQQHLREILANS